MHLNARFHLIISLYRIKHDHMRLRQVEEALEPAAEPGDVQFHQEPHEKTFKISKNR